MHNAILLLLCAWQYATRRLGKSFIELFLSCIQKRWTVHNNVCLDCPLRIAPKAILTTRFAVQMDSKCESRVQECWASAEGAGFSHRGANLDKLPGGCPKTWMYGRQRHGPLLAATYLWLQRPITVWNVNYCEEIVREFKISHFSKAYTQVGICN